MAEGPKIPKEERLFLELGRRRGAITPEAVEAAIERARAGDVTVVEALVSANGIALEAADAVRKALFKLSFTCATCESVDFVEPDETPAKGLLCEDCARKKDPAAAPAPAAPARASAPTPAPAPKPKAPKPPTVSMQTLGEEDLARAPAAPAPKPKAPKPPTVTMKTVQLSDVDLGKTVNEPVEATPRAPSPEVDPNRTVSDGATAAPSPSPSPPAGADDLASDAIVGGCRIEKKIGQGGMGRVYKAHHQGLDRDMAVKVLDDRLVAKKGFVEQFIVEARVLAKLDHPNVVRVFNVDQDAESKRHFIVMELLEGGSVEALWKKHQKKLPLDEALRIVRQAAEGLHHAHRAGLIHRDVKPGNLMLTGDGRVKVVDFGLAVPTQGELFIATEIAGTPLYMAPEQCDGLKLDHRCDQYALGVTLYQLLCGRGPFEKTKAIEILFAHVGEPPPPPRDFRDDLPEWLEQAILRSLAKAPADRYPSLAEFLAALEQKTAPATAPPAAAKPAPLAINLSEITQLEKGRKIQPVAMPSWKPAAAAIAGCVATAVLFLGTVAREAWAGGDDEKGGVPTAVTKSWAEIEAQVRKAQPEDLAHALTRLDEEVQDLGARPGASFLAEQRKAVQKRLDDLKASTLKELETRFQALVAGKRLGAAIELADPDSRSLAALGLSPALAKLRDEARAALEKRGEVWVPAGPFRSGPEGKPAETRGFYLDRTEVTNEAWARAAGQNGIERPAGWPSGDLPPGLAKKPVTGVTFAEAERFARAVGKRLPTSLEWEKAARGTADARAWPWGERFEADRANLVEGGSGALEEVTARPKDVSPTGTLGLAGNAFEWVRGDRPLVAGGAFRSHPLSGRVFTRFTLEPETRHPAVGFRCARDPEE